MSWAEKDVRKKDDLAPLRTRMQRKGRTGLYYVLKSMEQGPSFRIVKPKFPVKDPTWRTLAPQRSRYTHLYFYIGIPALPHAIDSQRKFPEPRTLNPEPSQRLHPPIRYKTSLTHLLKQSKLKRLELSIRVRSTMS